MQPVKCSSIKTVLETEKNPQKTELGSEIQSGLSGEMSPEDTT